jgi:3-hydroxyisobutyrate dehydrogenase/2-hydroxy-3-oxopropionate reductase
MNAVAVVGLGAMGSRMAARLLDAGHPVTVWNRSPAAAAALSGLGATVAATPAEAAAGAQALITMVSGPRALRAVTEGAAGVAAGAHGSLTVIEMSTVGPDAVTRLAGALPAGTGLLDAPVLGSVPEAEAGTLTILAGGPAAEVDRARPLLSVLGTVVAAGPLGSGAAAKLTANMALFSTVAALGEAIALGRALGLRPDVLADVLAVTPLADQAVRRRPAIDADDYPRRFALSLARKDADLIGQAARSAGAELRLAEAARGWLADAEAAGWGEHDYTAVLAAILGPRHPRAPACGDPACGAPAPRPRRYDGLILDLDGVVWLGSQPIAGAAEAIARLRGRGTRVVFLTNDPGESRARQAARLAAAGIPATADDVITSGYAMARYLASCPELDGRPALVCGPPALRKEIARAGIRPVSRDRAGQAGMVIVAGHEGFGYAELRAAIRAIAGGAALFATGRDPVVPTSDGPLPATGAVLAAVEAATGVTATVIGKPHPFVFGIARDALPGCEHIAMVGDNLAADIAGARHAGLEAILVLTGATTEHDLGRSPVQPDRVLPSLAALGTELEGD